MFPLVRLGSGKTGTEPFFVDQMGKTWRKAFGERGASKGLQREAATSGRRRNDDGWERLEVVEVGESGFWKERNLGLF